MSDEFSEPQPVGPPQPELPRWESHKRVSADRIVGVADGGELVLFRWMLACGAVIDVHEWLASRVPPGTPALDGFYIRYDDGYESWSPAEAFEAGYTRVATEA